MFVLLFHPELAFSCEQAFRSVLQDARQSHPPVWIASLKEISSWWREKAGFKAVSSQTPSGLQIHFLCSERATILLRGLGDYPGRQAWDGPYSRLKGRHILVRNAARPFIGLPADAPRRIVSFLEEQGYILDQGATRVQCATHLDQKQLNSLQTERELVHYIEASRTPLVRYWRWPDGAKSALAVTGDLDALTLLDYGSRLLVRHTG
jgi:hypothetical protein